MTGKVLHYFAGDHTAKGFYPMYTTNYEGLEHIFLLKGSSKKVKSSLIKEIAATWMNNGYDVELIHCSSDNDALDGLIIPRLKIGLHDSASSPLEINVPTEDVNVDDAWNEDNLNEQWDTISRYNEKINKAFESAHESFKTGLLVHDDLEEIYMNNMDYDKANQVADDLINRLYGNETSTGKTAHVKYRFFGASTPQGVVDYIPNITDRLQKRYFIKGRAGTGKSTLLKKVAAAAVDLGLDVEMYHCGFDPESLDMVVVRELGFCVFDSTDPHEYFPEQDGDEIIDIYKKTVKAGTDEKYAKEIQELTHSYKSYMKQGVSFLREAKRLKDERTPIYIDGVDDSKVDRMYQKMNQQLEDKAGHLE
ncbi:hypothetical protein D7Z54_26535 [Salibacterium salarium]|uniref:Uncharacterized protein n=1 Tax=Salibacterium salarium TaxID=284579 RepID=A0A428MVW9_9BACI|nr:PRK06851 family protein [Salibacterium salarium]RSL30277.1 hypothetical protein D7Z54_26535 [Salibacterium salarium]